MERETQLKCKIPLWRKLLGRVRRHGQQGNKNVKYGHPAFQADEGIKCGSKPPPLTCMDNQRSQPKIGPLRASANMVQIVRLQEIHDESESSVLCSFLTPKKDAIYTLEKVIRLNQTLLIRMRNVGGLFECLTRKCS